MSTQTFLIDFLLRSYLKDRSSSIDLSRLNLSNLVSSNNALLTLEKVYLSVQQAIITTKSSNSDEQNVELDNENVLNDKNAVDSSQITITVCDEGKSLKRQFTCNRTLLVREMRYFADYLTTEPEQLDEVDISVHCDLDIFQWLMSFVNRQMSNTPPELEPRIAISILISSDFLKMDKLVAQSLDYIHDHINEIMASNCNIACIPEAIFRQLAKRFDDPLEIEQIQDRKNKIRGKLFEYNLEYLLTSTKLIRCQHCSTTMTVEQMDYLSCQTDRLVLKPSGRLCFQHKIDPKFDVNHWLKEIHSRAENSWRNTFWIFWLHIHGDQCARCNGYFRFIDFATCPYHPSSIVTENKHECCSRLITTFDILQLNSRDYGCQHRDHICQTANRDAQIFENLDKKDLIKSQTTSSTPISNPTRTNDVISKIIEQSIFSTSTNEAKKGTLQTIWTPLLDLPPCGPDIKYSWDASKSTRWNQDAQREDEHRRFDEMLRSIHVMQQNNKANHRSLKDTTTSNSNYPGGIYCRIENDWRTRQSTPATNHKTRTRINLNFICRQKEIFLRQRQFIVDLITTLFMIDNSRTTISFASNCQEEEGEEEKTHR